MKVAIVHDWLTGMRGGEKVLDVICENWPEADLYTLLYVPGKLTGTIENRRIVTSFVQKLPAAPTWYRNYLPLFPFAIERFDLRDYDLVISSSHCVAKGVRTADAAFHVSYIHTPMRYVWEMFDEYFGPGKIHPLKRLAARAVRPYLQRWDVKSAARVDAFVANSRHVAKRIARHYGRDAEVIHPPVQTEAFYIDERVEDFYLIVSAFAPYKRIDLAIEAFARLGRPLKVVGAGQDERKLLGAGATNVEFLGWQTTEQIRDLYAHCRAFIFPGEEDFGITPLEAQASGRPVIAYAKGGVLETVRGAYPDGRRPADLCTGVFFEPQTVEALMEAVVFFEQENPISPPKALREHAQGFDRAHFGRNIRQYIQSAHEAFLKTRGNGSGHEDSTTGRGEFRPT